MFSVTAVVIWLESAVMRAQADVAIFGLNFPPEVTGIAPYTGALAASLTEAGYTVTAHVSHPHYPEWTVRDGYGEWKRIENHSGVKVVRRAHYVPHSPRGLRRLLSEWSFGLRLVFARWRRPSVVVAVSPSLFATALVALRIRMTVHRPSFFVWVQDLYTLGLAETQEGGAIVQRITRWVESRTLRAADEVVVIHPRFVEYMASELKVPPSRVRVIRNWTHLAAPPDIEMSYARTRLGWPLSMTLVVHTGNMGAKQGLENVVDAARVADERNAPVHFILVGDGGERRSLEERAAGVSRVQFVDPLTADDYPIALAAADVLLVNERPGVAAMAVPSKLTSYFNAGRPIIAATDPQGITAEEIRSAHAGVVVAAGDPGALVDAAMSLGRDSQTSGRFAANGRRYRESELDVRAATDRWLSLIAPQLAARQNAG